MKKYIKVKYFIIMILVIIILFALNKIVTDVIQRPVEMVEAETVWQDAEIQKSELTNNSIVTWDNTNLKIYNLQGELINEVIGNGYYTNVYFFGDEIYVLDKQLNVLYIYNSTGELNEKIQLSGSVYSIFKKENQVYLHRKDELNNQRIETITKLEGERRESPLFETNRFIINFLEDGNTLYLSEITAENFSYKSVLNIVNRGENQILDFGNETVMDMKTAGRKLIVITNKNLYLIDGNDRQKVELNNFVDYHFENRNVVVLYDNKLVKFNDDLSVAENHEINISTSGLLSHDGSYFVYGPTDVVGFVGEDREFTKSFDAIVTSISSNDNALLVTHKYNLDLYTFEVINNEE